MTKEFYLKQLRARYMPKARKMPVSKAQMLMARFGQTYKPAVKTKKRSTSTPEA